jgi:hypothetical protein
VSLVAVARDAQQAQTSLRVEEWSLLAEGG